MGYKVEAIQLGYYDHKRRRPDHPTSHFEIEKKEEFSHTWMRAVGWAPPPPKKKIVVNDLPIRSAGGNNGSMSAVLERLHAMEKGLESVTGILGSMIQAKPAAAPAAPAPSPAAVEQVAEESASEAI